MKKLLLWSTLIVTLLSACAVPTPTLDTPMPGKAVQDETPIPEATSDAPAWFAATLTDARTGKIFSINDLKGKVVLVETMAQWCSNCMKQQTQVKALHGIIGANDDFVSIGLDIDPNENVDDLKTYVEKREFDWLYAVPPVEVTHEIGNLYTAQFLNPPSTPILIVDRNGIAHPLPFGIKSADDLAAAVKMYLAE